MLLELGWAPLRPTSQTPRRWSLEGQPCRNFSWGWKFTVFWSSRFHRWGALFVSKVCFPEPSSHPVVQPAFCHQQTKDQHESSGANSAGSGWPLSRWTEAGNSTFDFWQWMPGNEINGFYLWQVLNERKHRILHEGLKPPCPVSTFESLFHLSSIHPSMIYLCIIYLSIHQSSIHLSIIYFSIYPSFHLWFLYLSIHPSINHLYLSIFLSSLFLYISTCPSINHLSIIYLYINQSIHHLSIYHIYLLYHLSIYLHLSSLSISIYWSLSLYLISIHHSIISIYLSIYLSG